MALAGARHGSATEAKTLPRVAPVNPSPGGGALCDSDGHGRFEIRRYYQSAELDWFADRAKW
jgi:hypothetical protein